MDIIPIHQAKSSLSKLVKRAKAGETIHIGSYGRAEVALVAVQDTQPKKRLGVLAGKLRVPEDFDAPLPDDILNAFEGTDTE
ncbi:MAG: type II toxin-antitoxin system Phd/YefM family antitoxin [Methylobacteriaceae bacterium]|jgi:antitoxin (DNA-binding transcriptional repressor) of toxin-antitoxin stability system|nr:type II toxin-antitoxin system Phd/YefM family antitoxin [Methylobacteriaceae bacterium]